MSAAKMILHTEDIMAELRETVDQHGRRIFVGRMGLGEVRVIANPDRRSLTDPTHLLVADWKRTGRAS